ncbi:MAG TPA: hypothetical protein VJK02_11635 [Anaerolineales bacterium]|nr:hypothetical protein [Anaerolineales bacterium]
MSEIVGFLFISSGAAVCIGGAAAFWSLQASTSGGTLWPLPALALLDWGILGFAGFVSAQVGAATDHDRAWPGPWGIAGALLPLAFIGALSIGPLVLLSAILFFIGAGWNRMRRSKVTGQDLRWIAGGIVGNLLLLSLFITLA